MAGKWIWYPGDFEVWHNLNLHTKRIKHDVGYPAFWHLSVPYPSVVFTKEFDAEAPFVLRAVCHRYDCGRILIDGEAYALNTDVCVEAGRHVATAEIMAIGALPAVYMDSEYVSTDESWSVSIPHGTPIAAACVPAYYSPSDDVGVFPFSYEPIAPVSVSERAGGLLYDYGKETFARITLKGTDPARETVLYYGESEEEALDHAGTVAFVRLSGSDSYVVPPRALRYLHVIGQTEIVPFAEYEYLPISDVGRFECDDPLVNEVYKTCVYTLHLNSREFYLDGIKRDRWVWAGDAYQSFMVNRYLYFEPEIIKRTILALLGKPPYLQHVNTINDYSMYVILSVYEYYLSTGDNSFVLQCFDKVKALYDFIASRTDENDYVCYRENDWIFIDWSDMDKSAPLAAEQILYWKTKRVMAELSMLCGLDGSRYEMEAAALKSRIERDFYDKDRVAYVDCVGSRHVTRHPNIFAILFDFVPEGRQAALAASVLDDDTVTAITTPYFKFFELCARCKIGDLTAMQSMLTDYWGEMIRRGATAIWEQFDPNASGVEHLAMYGQPYDCSLCHAWGSGPIYLLGRYVLGVSQTSLAYKTFTVEPKIGRFRYVDGVVPLPGGGSVSVYADENTVRVTATAAGGTLFAFGREYALPAGETLTVTR